MNIPTRETTVTKIIGSITTYHGTEHAYLVGHDLKIVAVLKGFDADNPDPDGVQILTTDAEVEAAGGVRATDRVEVVPWIDVDGGRWSFVTSDPLACDLECFSHLVEGR